MTRVDALTLLIVGIAAPSFAQTPDLALVVVKAIARNIELPGEIHPYLAVSLHAKVPGYVDRLLVDRGSIVDRGQLLVELSAPELAARIAEAEAKVQQSESDRLQAEAQLAAAQSTYERLKKAAETPGAVAGNDLIQAEKQVEAAEAMVRSRQQAGQAAQAAAKAEQDLQAYLRITAPFDGVVTERLLHPGALVGPTDAALLVIQQISKLRLVVAVPEEYLGGVVEGAKVAFHVPAFPERTYFGAVARVSHVLDPATRTMPVELDVENPDRTLAPGMYPSVTWPVRQSRPGLFAPRTSVVTTTERTFVIRDQNGRAEWVDVRKGAAEGDFVQVFGDLKAGDRVVRRATDEIREGTALVGR
jgi:RND family efflux transporter MFP subunit